MAHEPLHHEGRETQRKRQRARGRGKETEGRDIRETE